MLKVTLYCTVLHCNVLYLLAKLEHGVELQHLLHGEGQLGAAPGAAGLARRSEGYKMKNVKTVKIKDICENDKIL